MKILFLGFLLILSETISAQEYVEDIIHKTVVSIGRTYNYDGEKIHIPSGTGVMSYINIDGKSYNVIITARHVLESLSKYKSITVRAPFLNPKTTTERLGVKVKLVEDGGKTYTVTDEDTDLAIIYLTGSKEQQRYFQNNTKAIPRSMFGKIEDYWVGNDIQIAGYPGIVDIKYRSYPILRSGIISWAAPTENHPKEFLVDSDIFGGNSGGPVFTRPRINVKNKKYNIEPVRFLGIVVSKFDIKEPIYNNKNEIQKDSTGIELINREDVGIAKVISAHIVLEVIKSSERYFNKKK